MWQSITKSSNLFYMIFSYIHRHTNPCMQVCKYILHRLEGEPSLGVKLRVTSTICHVDRELFSNTQISCIYIGLVVRLFLGTPTHSGNLYAFALFICFTSFGVWASRIPSLPVHIQFYLLLFLALSPIFCVLPRLLFLIFSFFAFPAISSWYHLSLFSLSSHLQIPSRWGPSPWRLFPVTWVAIITGTLRNCVTSNSDLVDGENTCVPAQMHAYRLTFTIQSIIYVDVKLSEMIY